MMQLCKMNRLILSLGIVVIIATPTMAKSGKPLKHMREEGILQSTSMVRGESRRLEPNNKERHLPMKGKFQLEILAHQWEKNQSYLLTL
jgi:hypothetical protein